MDSFSEGEGGLKGNNQKNYTQFGIYESNTFQHYIPSFYTPSQQNIQPCHGPLRQGHHQQSHIDERTSEKETHCNFELIIKK